MARAVGETSAAWPDTNLATELSRVPAGRIVTTPPILFSKIEDSQVTAWSERFGAG
jgi:hypothetical protein